MEVNVRQMKWTIKPARKAVGLCVRGTYRPHQWSQQSCARLVEGGSCSAVAGGIGKAVSPGFAFIDAYVVILA